MWSHAIILLYIRFVSITLSLDMHDVCKLQMALLMYIQHYRFYMDILRCELLWIIILIENYIWDIMAKIEPRAISVIEFFIRNKYVNVIGTTISPADYTCWTNQQNSIPIARLSRTISITRILVRIQLLTQETPYQLCFCAWNKLDET